MTSPIRSEAQVENRIRDVLAKFQNQRFNGITITAVVSQHPVGDNRRADIVVLKDDGMPLLIIETKRKIERYGGWRVERNFIVSSPEVVGQAMAYAALLHKNGIHVPFIATANDRQIAVFLVPEDLENFVDWEAVRKRDYGRVIRNFYDYRHNYMLLHDVHSFSEQYFRKLLDKLTGIYAKTYSLKDKRQKLHWILIEDLRGFVDFLTQYVLEAIAPNGTYRDEIAEMVEDYARRRGYSP
ncbi:MAG: hypothetical protein ACP5IE_10265, partial [Infirmifilum sp.]